MRLDQLLLVIWHALPWWVPAVPLLSLTAAMLGSPRGKGWVGEMLLHLRLRMGLDRSRYRLFRNLILPTPDGTTQIDHVVVSRHGIFVIETKNYAGWIFGSERNRMWTQKFPRRSHTFQNPLRQNYKHVRALAELIGRDCGVDETALFSLVVFVGDSTFKTPMPDNVTHAGGCLAYLRARTATLLSEAEVEAVIARIEGGRVAPSRAANAAHVRHVQALVAARHKGGKAPAPASASAPAPAPAAMRTEPHLAVAPSDAAQPSAPLAGTATAPCCPRCGSALGDYTFRSGERAGQIFRGCIRFPDCSYRIHLPAPATTASAGPATAPA